MENKAGEAAAAARGAGKQRDHEPARWVPRPGGAGGYRWDQRLGFPDFL